MKLLRLQSLLTISLFALTAGLNAKKTESVQGGHEERIKQLEEQLAKCQQRQAECECRSNIEEGYNEWANWGRG